MRPVNLIPADERRGASRGSAQSTGYAPYILLGVLAVAVLGVYLMVSASNQVSEKQAKLDQLDQQVQQEQSEVEETPVTGSVKEIAQARFDAVSATIDSRFNFERRLRQLGHVLPANVGLTELTAKTAPGAAGAAAAGGDAGAAGGDAAASGATSGPSFDMTLCSASGSWSMVAVVITRMRNIDGVIKVKLDGELTEAGGSDSSGAGAASTEGSSAGGACGENDWTYPITVTFDAGSSGGPSVTAAASTSTPATATQQAQSAVPKADQASGAAGSEGGAGQ